MKKAAFFSIFLVFLLIPCSIFASTYTVNTPEATNDSVCTDPYVDAANDCTIYEAIAAANAHGGLDTVNFNIHSFFQADPAYYNNGQYTITMATGFGGIYSPIIVNGSSVWDVANNRPGIRLYSTNTTINAINLSSGADNSKVQGMEIEGFNTGISVGASNSIIGTDCDGSNDSLERNVIHYAYYTNIGVSTSNNIIAGNYINFNSDGITPSYSDGYGVIIAGKTADNNLVGYQEGTSGICSNVIQRNVITSNPNSAEHAAIRLNGAEPYNYAGDSSLGPDHNIIAGNYIGVDKTGLTDQSGYYGVYISYNATLNFVGTDGDGFDDELEGNVIDAAVYHGIHIWHTGNNRISGNLIGIKADQSAILGSGLKYGIVTRGESNIIGWCDTTINSNLCSNAGSALNQANIVGGASMRGINIGIDGPHNVVYGNYIGVSSDGTKDLGNEAGLYFNESNNIGGGTGNKKNIIKYNDIGVLVNNGVQARENVDIKYNEITDNDTAGIRLSYTERYTAGGPTSINIENNQINNNGGNGIELWGSSANILNNNIQNNNGYAIFIRPGYIYVNELDVVVENFSPANYATNIQSLATVSGNDISGNSSGGIYLSDTHAVNEDTLFSGNIFGDNNSNNAITQAWLGAVEVLNKNNSPIGSDYWNSEAVTITAANGSQQSSTTNSAAGGDDMIFGPSTVSYSNVSTWFPIIDYTINQNGQTTNYNPYTITVSGPYASASVQNFSFDGSDNDAQYTDVLPNGLVVGDYSLYQVAKVKSSTIPAKPTNILPADDEINVSLAPTLAASAFSDTEETHQASIWKLYINDNCSNQVYSSHDSSNLTSHTLPSGYLNKNTTYYWNVSYKNSFGNYSDFSDCTAITTIATNIVFTDIADLSWDEDTAKNITLNNYFSTEDSTALTYSVQDNPAHVQADINNENSIVTLTPEQNWHGTNQIIFIATDSLGEQKASNEITLTVEEVNDPPQAVASGFSPQNKAKTSSLTPTLSWTAASDPDNKKSELTYQVRISTNKDPINNAQNTFNTSAGGTAVKISAALIDETTYYWAVRAIDPEKVKSEWSEIKHFYVNKEHKPEIVATKVVTIGAEPFSFLGSIMKKALAATPAAVEFRNSFSFLYSLPFVIFFLLFSTLFIYLTYRFVKKPKHLFQYLFAQPAMSFSYLIKKKRNGTYTISYSFYKKNNILSRLSLVLASVTIIVLVLFIQLGPASLAADDNGKAVEPNTYLQYTIFLENQGDGDANNVRLIDTIPNGTVLDENSEQSSNNQAVITASDNTINVAIPTLEKDKTASFSYVVQVTNPNYETAIISSSANLQADDISETVTSNTVSNPLIVSVLNLWLKDSAGSVLSAGEAMLYSNNQRIAYGISNNAGLISFSGLASGSYYVNISGPKSNPFIYSNYYTLARGEIKNETVNLPSAAEEDIDNSENNDDFILIMIGEQEYKIPKNIEPPTTDEEKQEIKNLMELFLKLLSLNGQSVANMPYFEAILADTAGLEEYKDTNGNLKTIIKISGNELMMKGITLPNAEVTVIIKSDPIVKVTQADANGRWELRIPIDLIPPGDHTIYATSELYAVKTDEIILGKFSVPEPKHKLSKTTWLVVINLSVLLIITLIIVILLKKKSDKKIRKKV